MLWIILPIYFVWIFTEIYQEKKGTSLGNAISNGMVALWIGADWSRVTIRFLDAGEIALDWMFFAKVGGAVFFIMYGLVIIVSGIQVKKITKYIGRIREVSYLAIMFTPIIYGAVAPTVEAILAILVLFPIFYILIEVIDKYTPNPKTYDESDMPDVGKDMPDFKDLDKGLAEPAMPQMPAQMPQMPGGNLRI